MKKNIVKLSLAVFMISVTFSGCANKDLNVSDLEKKLEKQESVIAQQAKDVEISSTRVTSLEKELANKQDQLNAATSKGNQAATVTTSATNSGTNSSLVPPYAKAGECYSKVLTPVEYKNKTEKKLLEGDYKTLSVTKPTFKNVTYKIVEKNESYKYVTIPATYKCVENKVMVSPEKTTYKVIPATFKTVKEKIVVSPATENWKVGKGAITKVNNTTGEIMCLVKTPAKYKTISAKVVDVPASTQKIVTPAKYAYIKAKAVDVEASYKKVVIPATYKTVTVQELVTEAKINEVVTDKKYQTITKTFISKEAKPMWKKVICETNQIKK